MRKYTEEEILNKMYTGEEKRDASSKISGFIYQDLIAIEKMLDKETECVATEFLEDITYIKKDELYIAQVKHYPKTTPKLEEIVKDLYYQFLRYTLLGGNKKAYLQLIIHHKSDIAKPTEREVQSYIAMKEIAMTDDKKTVIDTVEVLNKYNGYNDKTNKEYTKAEKRDGFIKECAYKGSIHEFYECIDIVSDDSIKSKIEGIKNKISIVYSGEQCELVFGLAIQYVQERYYMSNIKLEKIKLTKKELDFRLNNLKSEEFENKITAYIYSVVYEYYSKIIDGIDRVEGVDEKDISTIKDILRICYNTTINWIKELVSTEEGRYQLINTVTNKSDKYLSDFKKLSDDKIFTKVKECRGGIEDFLSIIWKLMLNVCLDKKDLNDKDIEMMNIKNYIDNEQSDFISIRFEKFKKKDIIILPSFRQNDDMIDDIKNIFTRIKAFKPKTWYIKGMLKANKLYTYNFEVSRLDEEGPVSELSHDITDIDEDYFTIECMKCLKTRTSSDCWTKQDECWKCVFEKGCEK